MPADMKAGGMPSVWKSYVTVDDVDSLPEKIKALGYLYVALDMAGYRTGSMNEALPGAVRSGNLS